MTQAQGPIYAIEKDIKRDKEKKHGAINALWPRAIFPNLTGVFLHKSDGKRAGLKYKYKYKPSTNLKERGLD